MGETGGKSGKTRDRVAQVTPAPTRSQVNRESKAPSDGGRAAKPPPQAAKPPPGPLHAAGNDEPPYGRRRGDQPEVSGKSPEVETWREGGRGDASGPGADPRQKPQHSWRISAVAAQILLALICVTTESSFNERSEESNANISLQAQPQPQAGPEPQILSVSPGQNAAAPNTDEALMTALDDLGDALEAHPERSPEELLRQVSTQSHDCRLAWHDHVPSLVFGKEPIEGDSLANTIHACADAVRRLQ